VDRIYQGQHRGNWQAVVEAVMNLRVQLKARYLLTNSGIACCPKYTLLPVACSHVFIVVVSERSRPIFARAATRAKALRYYFHNVYCNHHFESHRGVSLCWCLKFTDAGELGGRD
jgi:hypothetical protein